MLILCLWSRLGVNTGDFGLTASSLSDGGASSRVDDDIAGVFTNKDVVGRLCVLRSRLDEYIFPDFNPALSSVILGVSSDGGASGAVDGVFQLGLLRSRLSDDIELPN
jgi:hypothetical protein